MWWCMVGTALVFLGGGLGSTFLFIMGFVSFALLVVFCTALFAWANSE